MSSLSRYIADVYHAISYEYVDPRTADYVTVLSPLSVLLLELGYFYFANKLGPAFMRYRKPYQIDRWVQVYNALQVVINAWLFCNMWIKTYSPWGTFSWTCEPVGTSTTPEGMQIVNYVWVYYMLKLADLLDTVFFIMRKKESQLTFLHIYHHAGMIITGWMAIKYYPGGHGVMVGVLNSLVHAVMYSYYFLSSYSPKYKNNVWWKKYITQLQMFQFLCLIIHLTPILFQPSCTYPKWVMYLFLPQNVVILYLFWQFYKKTYLQPKGKSSLKAS